MKKSKIGVALSGGGYRAAAYHIGTLRALDRLGVLKNVDVMSSVSGGSIIAAYYGLNHDKYGSYKEFEDDFAGKLRKGVLLSASINLILFAISVILLFVWLGWWASPVLPLIYIFWYTICPFSYWIERSYNRLFYRSAKLKDLNKKPLIAINSTDVSTGTLFTFSQVMISANWKAYKDKVEFLHEEFPIARAVMASSCVPFAFSPIKIDSKYYEGKYGDKVPLLIDGGLYDNQGAHKLSESGSYCQADYIIVSDAGADEMNSKNVFNIVLMLVKTSQIMMNRIKTFQMRNNVFNVYNDRDYAYVVLGWDTTERLINNFVDNLIKGYIEDEVCEKHSITQADIDSLKVSDKEELAKNKRLVADKVKLSIDWARLESLTPTDEEHQIAKTVGTNLTALKSKQIDALTKHSDWLTEVQVRLYLPTIINQ